MSLCCALLRLFCPNGGAPKDAGAARKKRDDDADDDAGEQDSLLGKHRDGFPSSGGSDRAGPPGGSGAPSSSSRSSDAYGSGAGGAGGSGAQGLGAGASSDGTGEGGARDGLGPGSFDDQDDFDGLDAEDLDLTDDSIRDIIEPQLKALESLDPDLLSDVQNPTLTAERRANALGGDPVDDLLATESTLDAMMAELNPEPVDVPASDGAGGAGSNARRRAQG